MRDWVASTPRASERRGRVVRRPSGPPGSTTHRSPLIHPAHAAARRRPAPASLPSRSTTTHSVVSSSPAIDAAFCSAVRVTLVGSMTPAFTRSSYVSVCGVVAEVPLLRLPDPRHDDGALGARVLRDLPDRLLERAAHDLDADLLVLGARESCSERALRPEQRDAAAGHDALLDRRASGVQRVLDPGLLLLHLGLGRGAHVDDRHAAGELGQPLLELLPVVVAGALLDGALDLVDAALDRRPACPCRPRSVVLSLSTTIRLARPRSSSAAFSSLKPTSSEITWPPVSTAMSRSISLRRSPKPGAFTAQTLSVPRSLFTTSVASASPSTSSAMIRRGFPACATFSRIGQQLLHRRDLLVVDQDDRRPPAPPPSSPDR